LVSPSGYFSGTLVIAKTPLKDQKDQQSKINNQRSISKKTASLQKQHRQGEFKRWISVNFWMAKG
jgi:hypothetical protein